MDDIDLPFVISKKQCFDFPQYKEDFTNIILVFDYERHDQRFSKQKIKALQMYFCDPTDMGKLYINYPMIESYLHLKGIPDDSFIDRKISVSLRPGSQYKKLVRKETAISEIIDFPRRIKDLLENHYKISEFEVCEYCCNAILSIHHDDDMENKICDILKDIIEHDLLLSAKHHFKELITKLGYAKNGQTYWEFTRGIFKDIIRHNIRKASRIQNIQSGIEGNQYHDCFDIISTYMKF